MIDTAQVTFTTMSVGFYSVGFAPKDAYLDQEPYEEYAYDTRSAKYLLNFTKLSYELDYEWYNVKIWMELW